MPYAPATDSSFFTRRGLVFAAIILLHVGMFYLLNSGLSHQIIDVVLGPIETRMIEEAPKQEEPPPPPPPKIETPPPFVPPPEISIDIPADAPPTKAIQQTTTVKPTAPPPVAAPPPVQRTAPRSDARRPLTQPEYPPSSRRAGEAGTVILEVYVLENGRVGEARVKQSSGYPRLDEAAMREVKRSWRLVPGTENGKPVPMWGQFAVTFKLTD
ncbi:MAG TPA: energy transducer TonB [Steroidobacter sp.]|uniref:energy transducer TonB n=1 Tax=Steroidobacter sp. TaxID=1978227 RepID=UPI002ED84B2C